MNSKKITKLSKASVCYFWKNYECELCKKIYPLNLDLKNPMIDYETPNQNYMVLESLTDTATK